MGRPRPPTEFAASGRIPLRLYKDGRWQTSRPFTDDRVEFYAYDVFSGLRLCNLIHVVSMVVVVGSLRRLRAVFEFTSLLLGGLGGGLEEGLASAGGLRGDFPRLRREAREGEKTASGRHGVRAVQISKRGNRNQSM